MFVRKNKRTIIRFIGFYSLFQTSNGGGSFGLYGVSIVAHTTTEWKWIKEKRHKHDVQYVFYSTNQTEIRELVVELQATQQKLNKSSWTKKQKKSIIYLSSISVLLLLLVSVCLRLLCYRCICIFLLGGYFNFIHK